MTIHTLCITSGIFCKFVVNKIKKKKKKTNQRRTNRKKFAMKIMFMWAKLSLLYILNSQFSQHMQIKPIEILRINMSSHARTHIYKNLIEVWMHVHVYGFMCERV